MFYGLDVHKDFVQVCQLSAEGKVLGNFRLGGDRESLERFSSGLKRADSVVLETTFNSWAVYAILKKSQARIVVSDSNKVKAIAHARVKTDKVDAEILAQLLRADFIPEVTMPSEETWGYRQLVSHLRVVTKQKTAIKNSIWGIVNRHLLEPPMENPFTKAGKNWLREVELDVLLRLQMDNLLNLLEAVEDAIDRVEQHLEILARNEKDVQLLLSIPGVGLKVALGLVSAIGDIKRFDEPAKLASYFGLTPSIHQSANREYRGSITKEGTTYGRWLAVEAAQSMVHSGSPITASYYKIKNKKGHNVAVTSLARKLIVVVWHMLTKQEPYRYAKPERLAEKLAVLNAELPSRYMVQQKRITAEEIYLQASLPKLNEAKPAEKRAAVRNRKAITAARRKTSKIAGSKEVPC